MNKKLQLAKMQLALSALVLVASSTLVSQSAWAQIGDDNTSITGGPVYVEEEDVNLGVLGGQHDALTISGAVGLPLNPTAAMLPKGKVRVQANYYKLWDDSVTGGGSASGDIYGVYAATSISDKLEVSAGYERFDVSGSGDYAKELSRIYERTGLAVGVKYLVNSPTSPKDLRVAVGAGYSSALYKNTNVYAVASKSFGSKRRVGAVHVGVRYDRFKVDGGGVSESSSKASAFAGAELPIDSSGHFALVGEIQSKNANDNLGGAEPFSLSLRYQNNNGLGISAGIMRQGVLSQFVNSDSNLFVQVGKSF